MKATLCIDEAVGETRRALLDSQERPFRIDIERWSERGKRARLDEVWWGRVGQRTPGGRGWFVDLGLGLDAVIEPKTKLVEGALVPVRIKSEAWAEKGPVVSLADMKADVARPEKPGLHAAPPADPFLAQIEMMATLTGEAARSEVDAAIEEALAVTSTIPGGGEISIERTRALTAIDVDAAGRSGDEPEALALELNLAAAGEAARQVALRSLGGLVMIDFVGMQQRKSASAVTAALRKALAAALGRASEVLDLSALGVCEIAVARRTRPTAEAVFYEPVEREALDAIRRIESEGRANTGAKLRARVSAEALKWLETDPIGWRAALEGRIGARWTLEASPRRPGLPEVWAER